MISLARALINGSVILRFNLVKPSFNFSCICTRLRCRVSNFVRFTVRKKLFAVVSKSEEFICFVVVQREDLPEENCQSFLSLSVWDI